MSITLTDACNVSELWHIFNATQLLGCYYLAGLCQVFLGSTHYIRCDETGSVLSGPFTQAHCVLLTGGRKKKSLKLDLMGTRIIYYGICVLQLLHKNFLPGCFDNGGGKGVFSDQSELANI